MNKLAKLSIIAIILLLVTLFFGCNAEETPALQTGSIKLTLNSNVKSRGFSPDISMDISYYSISGQGPSEGDTFEEQELTGGTHEVSGLIPGEWKITVTGYNSNDKPIGKGVAFPTVTAGITKNVSILVEEIGGAGTFTLELEIPTGEGIVPIVSVKLTLFQEGQDPSVTSFDLATMQQIKLTDLPSGFHALAVQLMNSDSEMVWGNAYSLRIVNEKETKGTITVSSEELARWGGLDLTIVDGMPIIFEVDLSASRGLVHDEESVTLTAQPNLSGGNYTYWWFLNGKKLDLDSAASITLSDNLDLGRNNVSVIAIRSGVMASATKTVIKTDEPPMAGQAVTINGVNLGDEEVQQILADLGTTELPSEPGILFLAPHAFESPLSGETLPYSYEIDFHEGDYLIAEVAMNEGTFAAFMPLESYSGCVPHLRIILYESGRHFKELYIDALIPEKGPLVFWLDEMQMGSSTNYLRSVKKTGLRSVIFSHLPLTNAVGGPLSTSDFYVTEEAYVDSVTGGADPNSPGRYKYEIIVKSDYSDYNTSYPQFYVDLYTKPTIMVDGKRSLGSRQVTSNYLNYLTVPTLAGGQYLDMEDNVLEDGYYQNYLKQFRVSLDNDYMFAGWAGTDGTSFRNLDNPIWPNDVDFSDPSALPIPIIVAEGSPIVTAFYFERYTGYNEWDYSLVEAPLQNGEVLKIAFSENVKSTDGSPLGADNFIITGGTISNVTYKEEFNSVEVKIGDFVAGSFSIKLKDVVTTSGGVSIQGQLQFGNRIIQLEVNNDETKGSVTNCGGLFFSGDKIKVIVIPNPNYRVTKLNDNFGYYPSGGGDGIPVTYYVNIPSNVGEGKKYLISPEYQ